MENTPRTAALFFRPLLLTLAILCAAGTNASAASKGSSGSSPISLGIPMRLSISGGYAYGNHKYGSDKDQTLSYLGFGFDVNFPIDPIHTLIGAGGWYVPTGASGDSSTSSLLLLGAYVGYKGDANDLFLGPAFAATATSYTDAAAAPNQDMNTNVRAGCGLAGWRHYFGTGLTTGVGLNGYYCSASSYSKHVTPVGQAAVDSTVSEKANLAGGYLYFFLGWNDTKSLL